MDGLSGSLQTDSGTQAPSLSSHDAIPQAQEAPPGAFAFNRPKKEENLDTSLLSPLH